MRPEPTFQIGQHVVFTSKNKPAGTFVIVDVLGAWMGCGMGNDRPRYRVQGTNHYSKFVCTVWDYEIAPAPIKPDVPTPKESELNYGDHDTLSPRSVAVTIAEIEQREAAVSRDLDAAVKALDSLKNLKNAIKTVNDAGYEVVPKRA